MSTDFGSLKFNEPTVRSSIGIMFHALTAFKEAAAKIQTVSQYTSLRTCSVGNIDSLPNFVTKCVDGVIYEGGSLSSDYRKFCAMEASNMVIAGVLPFESGDYSMMYGDNDYQNGVEITDFSQFENMTPAEYFAYMRGSGMGSYGIDQNCVSPGKITEKYDIPIYFFDKDSIPKESDFASEDDYIDFIGKDLFARAEVTSYKEQYKYLEDYLTNGMSDNYGEGTVFSKKDASRVLSLVNSQGACTYAAMADVIAYEYRCDPERFEECYGFPLYKKASGENCYVLNSEQLLVDMYVYSNMESHSSQGEDAIFLFNNEGGLTVNPDYYKDRSSNNGYTLVYEKPVVPDDDSLYYYENDEKHIVKESDMYYFDDNDEMHNIEDLKQQSLSEFQTAKKTDDFTQEYLFRFGEDAEYNSTIITGYVRNRDPDANVNYEVLYNNNGQDVPPEDAYDLIGAIGDKMNEGNSVVMAVGPNGTKGYEIDREGGSTHIGAPDSTSGHEVYITEAYNNSTLYCATWGGEGSISAEQLSNTGRVTVVAVDIDLK